MSAVITLLAGMVGTNTKRERHSTGINFTLENKICKSSTLLSSGGPVLAVITLLAGMVRTNAKRGRHSTCTYHYFIEELILH